MATEKEKDLPALREEMDRIESMLASIEIKTEDDLKGLAERIKETKTYRVAAETKRDKSIDPAKAIIEEAKTTYNPIIERAKSVEGALKRKGEQFVTAQLATKKIADDRIAARVEKGTMREDTALKKMEENGTVQKRVTTGIASFGVRHIADYEITNEALIPEEYWNRTLDKARLRAAVVTAKLDVPGTRRITKTSSSIS